MFQYLIENQNRKILVKVDVKENLLEIAKQRFQEKGLLKSPNFHLEMWHAEYNTFCEVESADLPDGGLLKLVFDYDSNPGIVEDER